MTVVFAETILSCVAGYLSIGLITGILFVLFGVGRIDHAAHGANARFRLIILPGFIGLWPIMIIRLLSLRKINKPTD